ncbi:MAG: cell division protein FtsA [Bdellovibrionaceae bacterium]|nr:cell division protein FtsA [Pseudobdellovibrionaceae bacterium]
MESLISNNKTIVCGLDIGSTHVTAIVAEIVHDGLKVVGFGKVAHQGVRQGAIVDITKTTEAIKKARKEAELNSGHFINSAWVSCGGLHVRSRDSHGMVAIENKEVSKQDYERAIKTAKAIVLADDQQIIHVVPKEFIIDGQGGIRNPIGIQGLRMEVLVHIISGARTYFPNALKCIESAGLKCSGFVLQQLASSIAILSEDEKELGVCLADIGGGTTDLICYKDGAVIHTASLPIGGQHFTQDISIGLRTSPVEAEKIKKEFGHCLPQSSELEETFEVPGVGDGSLRTISRRNLCEIVEPRAEEAFKILFDHLDHCGLTRKMNAGVVLTGGGSQLKGFVELGKYHYDLPIRRGIPNINSSIKETICTSEMSAAVGLLLYGYEQLDKKEIAQRKNSSSASATSGGSFMNFAKQIRDLFS